MITTQKKDILNGLIVSNETMKKLNMYKYQLIPYTLPKTVGLTTEFDEDPSAFENKFAVYDKIFYSHKYENIRDEITYDVGWPLLTWEWIIRLKKLLKGKRCLEVLGGVGSLSKCLLEQGIDVICTSLNYNEYQIDKSRHWTHVEKLDGEEAIKIYGSNVDYIIMSWPPYDHDISYRCLRQMRCHSHLQMIFIGGLNPWIGDSSFRNSIKIVDYLEDINMVYPNWYSVDDSILIGE